MYLPAYSPELNPIEQFWSVVKSTQLLDRETLSTRIDDASNNISLNDLYGFISHSKRQIDNCYNKVKFSDNATIVVISNLRLLKCSKNPISFLGSFLHAFSLRS
jgi:transposase